VPCRFALTALPPSSHLCRQAGRFRHVDQLEKLVILGVEISEVGAGPAVVQVEVTQVWRKQRQRQSVGGRGSDIEWQRPSGNEIQS
jgi:hypothetical protein